MNKIEDLQKKPEAIRRRVLFVSITVLMFIVVFIWISTLKFSYSENKAQTEFTPLKVVTDIVKDGYNVFSASANIIIERLKILNEEIK